MSNKKSLKFDKSAFIAYKNTPITKEYTLGKRLVQAHLEQFEVRYIKQQSNLEL